MKNKTLSLSLMALMLFFSVAIQAQITGTVLEDATGDPVIGASILQVGTTNGVITDFDGNFELNVPEGAELQISYMGFQTQTVKAKKGMVVKLSEDSHQLQEVVAIGYGSQKKKEVTVSRPSLKVPVLLLCISWTVCRLIILIISLRMRSLLWTSSRMVPQPLSTVHVVPTV